MRVLVFCTLFATATVSANPACLREHGCRAFNAAADGATTVLELRQRGTVCLEAAEGLPGHSRHRCFRTLDHEGIRLFNIASLRSHQDGVVTPEEQF